jgi:autoinducer 2-degrading protein
MFVVCVHIQVKPESRDAFLAATTANARGTRQEPRNHRFDVLEAEEDPARFLLYEAYDARAGFEEHQRTAHYLAWKEAVKEMMAAPRQGVRYKNLLPADADF